MKLNYIIGLLALVLIFALVPTQQVKAQSDTLTVEWLAGDNLIVNSLYDAVMGDTVAGGARKNLNRVYKLKRGGYYWLTQRIANDGFPLRIVGEIPGNTLETAPAVVQMVSKEGSVDGRIFTGLHDMVLKNLWLTGRDDNGTQTYYQPIQIDANGKRFVFDNCVLEQTNFALIAFTGKDNVIYFTNNKFRNLLGKPSTQQWEGRGISIWADQDTVIVENNTFFNIQFTVLQIEGGAAKYLRFNHNTMINVGRNFMAGGWFRTAYFANNLLVNGFWHGEGYSDYSNPGRDPRSLYAGMWGISPLPSKYGTEAGRRILFTKFASWRDPFFTTKYGDTIRTQFIVGPVTRLDFLEKLAEDGVSKFYEQVKVVDTTWLSERPNFTAYPVSAAMRDSMWRNITQLRSGATPAADYHYAVTEYATGITWPLPENFAYSTPANLITAGTDGLPLGDLNWFPAQKATFEANKAAEIKKIEDMPGAVFTDVPVTEYEAELGTLGGTAAVQPFQGFSYFQMDGGGWIQWDFNIATAGQYDLNVWTHLRDNSMRGQRIIVNSVSIKDPKNWGEYIWAPEEAGHPTFGMPKNAWAWSLIKQSEILQAGALTLPAGNNTIRIESSWGWQNFAGINVLPAGNTTPAVELRAPDATFDIVALKAEGAPWVPSKFKSVELKSNGNVTLNINAPKTANYLFQIFYQNYSGPHALQLQVDGGASVNFNLESKSDSTGLDKLSGVFLLTEGAHTLKISGADAQIDKVTLVERIVQTDVEDMNLPHKFALEQNYPNPFNPATTINFTLGKASNVKLVVYNILGQKVATLVDSRMNPGPQSVVFDASRLATGVYFYKLEAGEFNQVKKMLLLK